MFVAATVTLYRVAIAVTQRPLLRLRTATAYGIGAAATFWLLTRVGAFIV